MKLIYTRLDKQNTKKKAIVVDNIGGMYVPIAQSLVKYFDVYYYSIVQTPFPHMSNNNIGYGTSITTIRDFWGTLNEYDIYIFPDIYSSSIANYLRSIGKLVWGGSPAEVLETDRKLFKQELSSVKMDIAPTKYIVGIDNLRTYLKSVLDKYIKVSYYRNDMETFHHVNYRQSEVWLDELSIKLGPLGDILEFMIEDSIDCIAEIGADGYVVNGNNPDNFLIGLEIKDLGYLGKASLFNEMAQPVVDVYNQFRPVLNKYKATGFYSSEIRVGEDGKDYYTDICMRAGSPPSNTYLQMITNWDEIIIGGCSGEVIEPKFNSKYGVEIILKSDDFNDSFLRVGFDKKYSDNIKLKGNIYMNGSYYITPFAHSAISMNEFGSVVVTGDNVETIINEAIEIANSIDCYGLNFAENALDKGKESLDKLEKAIGYKF